MANTPISQFVTGVGSDSPAAIAQMIAYKQQQDAAKQAQLDAFRIAPSSPFYQYVQDPSLIPHFYNESDADALARVKQNAMEQAQQEAGRNSYQAAFPNSAFITNGGTIKDQNGMEIPPGPNDVPGMVMTLKDGTSRYVTQDEAANENKIRQQWLKDSGYVAPPQAKAGSANLTNYNDANGVPVGAPRTAIPPSAGVQTALNQVPADVWKRYGVTDPSKLNFEVVPRSEYNSETNQSYDTFDLVDKNTGITLPEGNLGQITGNVMGALVPDAQGNLTYQIQKPNNTSFFGGLFEGLGNIISSDAVKYLAPFAVGGNLAAGNFGNLLGGAETAGSGAGAGADFYGIGGPASTSLTPAAIEAGLGTPGYGYNAAAASSGLFNPALIGAGAAGTLAATAGGGGAAGTAAGTAAGAGAAGTAAGAGTAASTAAGAGAGAAAGAGVLGTGLTATQLAALGSGVGSLLGSSTSNNAITNAQNIQNAAAAKSQSTLGDIYNQNLAFTKPYQNLGVQGANAIQSNMPYFQNQFNANDLATNLAPNYAFQLGQGQMANQRAANVGGGALSGNTLTGLNRYTQDYAGNAYQQAFNNYNTQRNNIYNTLSGIAGIGNTSNAQAIGAGNTYGTNTTNLATGLAAAQAGATVAQGQNQANTLNNIVNNAALLLGQNNASPSQSNANLATNPYFQPGG